MIRAACSAAVLLWLSGAACAGTLEDIKARGSVSCGVEANRAGVSILRDSKGEGLAADFCSALAQALVGRKDAVGFLVVTPAEAFAALQAEEVDVLLLTLPWRFTDEIEQGVMLVQPLLTHKDGGVFGPVVRHGDDGWFTLLRWAVLALQAQKLGDDVAAGGLGLSPNWMTDVISASGNYAEMIKRHKAALDQAGYTILPAQSGPQF